MLTTTVADKCFLDLPGLVAAWNRGYRYVWEFDTGVDFKSVYAAAPLPSDQTSALPSHAAVSRVKAVASKASTSELS